MWFWYITQARLEAAEREREARNERLARSFQRASVRADAPRERFFLRLRQAGHHA
jgi:hypothetical protein